MTSPSPLEGGLCRSREGAEWVGDRDAEAPEVPARRAARRLVGGRPPSISGGAPPPRRTRCPAVPGAVRPGTPLAFRPYRCERPRDLQLGRARRARDLLRVLLPPGAPRGRSARYRRRVRGVRLHDLRHTFAVLSLSAGAHYMAVSKWLGHESYVTTLTIYADYIDEGEGGKSVPLRCRASG